MMEILNTLQPLFNLFIYTGAFVIGHAVELVGLALPPLVQIINRDVHTEKERFVVSVVVCLIVAIVVRWNDLHTSSAAEVAEFWAILFAESQIIYKLYFKNSAFTQKLEQRLNPEPTPETPSRLPQ